jgi:SAM-dependent methyltransferase
MGWRSDAERNREYWDGWADEYQRLHGETLLGAAWGAWQIPEEELHVLGDVAGNDVLELGCGAARWSIALAARGAHCVGLDNSARQLEHARGAGADFPLVHAPAEAVPLPDESFDVVCSDHGAFSWGDPSRVTLEAARLLRPGGLVAFNTSSPLRYLCWDEGSDRESERLQRSYFDLRRIDDRSTVQFSPQYGEWIRILHGAGFVIENLVEVRAPAGATTSYDHDPGWSRRWPGENIWVARRT